MKRNLHFNGDLMLAQLSVCMKSLSVGNLCLLALLLVIGSARAQTTCEPSLNVSCPADVTVECGQESNFDATGTPAVSGEYCDLELVINFSDEVIASSSCGKIITRSWSISLGNLQQVCTQVITSEDTQGPVFEGLQSEIQVQCLEEVPGFQQATATDACSGDATIQSWSSNSGELETTCNASTALGPGADWAIWLPTLSSASGANFVFNSAGGHFDQYSDGTAHLYGVAVNTVNVAERFLVDLWFENKADWSTWASQGRSYKNDLLLPCAAANYTHWDYYELVGGFSTLTGAGALAGTQLSLYHMPASYYFGFQIGVGANNKNCANGMSGWFSYEGFRGAQAISGHGDVNVNLTCVPNLLQDCVNNTSYSYLYRATDDCGHATIFNQQINVHDTTAPVFSNCPESISIECSDPIPAAPQEISAIDNCLGDVAVEYLGETLDGGPCQKTLTRIWEARDMCNNRSNCIQVITILDSTAPVLGNLPDAEITVECDAVPSAASVSIADNCDQYPVLVYHEERIDGNCPSNYTLVRTWFGYDQCENTSATFTQTIRVQDTTAPVFAPYEFYAHIECDQIPDTIPAFDNCGSATVELVEEIHQSGGCLGVLQRTYRATDACGNFAEVEQFITIMDTVAPVATNAAVDVTIECGEEAPAYNPDFTDNCGSELSYDFSSSSESIDCITTITETYFATDYCDNTASVTRVITIVDTTQPVFVEFPSDLTISCEENLPEAEMPIATDNCAQVVSITYTDVMVGGNCPQSYSLVRTFTASDNCGNSVQQVQNIFVVDETAPVFSEQANEYTYECNSEIPVITPIVSDNCSAVALSYIDYTTTFIECGNFKTYLARNWGKASNPAGQYLTANFNAAFAGSLIVGCGGNTLQFNSAAALISYLPVPGPASVLMGSQINPTQSPNGLANQTIAAVLNVTFDEFDSAFASAAFNSGELIYNAGPFANMTVNQVIAIANAHLGGCANDYSLNDIRIALLQFNSAFAGNNNNIELFRCQQEQYNPCDQVISRNWTASDECGNTSTFTQTIHIVDTTAPVISGESEINRPCDDYDDVYVSVNDNCSEWIVDSYDEVVSGACAGNIIRHYTAMDNCGNVSDEFIQIIHLTDAIAPQINSYNEDFTVECGEEYEVQAPSFSDNCDQELDIESTFSATTENCVTTETYTWTATDHCGNSTSSSTVVTIIDTTNPYFTALPENVTVDCTDTIPGFGAYAAADNCDNDVQIAVEELRIDGDCPQSYTLERVYRAADNCGNQAIETRYVYVVDGTAPAFEEQVSEFTYECGQEIEVIEPTAYDNCGAVSLSYEDSELNGNSCQGAITRAWTASDACGNTSLFVQYITIVDTQAPVVNPYTIEQEMACDAVSNEIMISAEDCNEVIITYSDQHVSGSCAGRIIRTYHVEDVCGNETEGLIQQIFNLIDTTAPVVEIAPVDAVIECGEEIPAYTPTWMDNCADADDLIETALQQTTIDSCMTVIYQTWTCVDPCGNSSSISRTITIVDSTAPVFSDVPANEERYCNDNDVVAEVFADDNCSDVTITHSDVIAPGTCPTLYTIQRTYTARDACGNESSFTQLIRMIDNLAPVWGDNASSFEYECGSTAELVVPNASDACSAISLSHVDSLSNDLGCTSSFQRIWTAMDACGNISEPFVQYISFVDNTPPVISNCPSNLVVNCNHAVPNAVEVSATDACDSDVQVYFQETILGDLPAEGSIADCNLSTPVRPVGNPCGYPYDWSMVMFNMTSAHRWFKVVDGSLVQYPGGSLHLNAQLENVLTPGTGWNVDVWFNGGMNWAAWSNQSFPTSFKADCGGEDANFASWTYFLLQAGPGAEMSGYGNYSGSVINLIHAPANKYFGYQLGDGANNYNDADNGFGGWFSYTGSFRPNANQNFVSVTGSGDFAFELDCCPDYIIERQWTAIDCSGNSSVCSQTISFSPGTEVEIGTSGLPSMEDEALNGERTTSVMTVAPNPTGSQAQFSFKTAATDHTTLEVLDMTGKKVADLYNGMAEAGTVYSINLDVRNIATGVYLCRLINGLDVKMDRLIISK